MLLTRERLKELMEKLEAVRVECVKGHPLYSEEPIIGPDGTNFREELDPKRKGVKLQIELGIRGRRFLAIDPETGEVRDSGECRAK